jgi:hypothetical protein
MTVAKSDLIGGPKPAGPTVPAVRRVTKLLFVDASNQPLELGCTRTEAADGKSTFLSSQIFFDYWRDR